MTENEFLNILETTLNGEMPAAEVRANILYYRDYIDSSKGTKSEQEIMNELGDPRLIARTIISTYQLNHPEKHYESYGSSEYVDDSVHQEENSSYATFNGKQISPKKLKLIGWAIGIGTIVILLLVLSAVFWLGGVVVKVFLRFFLPIILILIGVTWIREHFRR